MKKEKGQQIPPKREQQLQQKVTISKSEANKRLDSFQKYLGIALIVSALLGIYLLVTDKSLWLLAVSHAYGLIAICTIDVILGVVNLRAFRKIVIISSGWAVLTIALQLGDVLTAPQYGIKLEAFAAYLFGLWAFDGLLAMQGAIVAIGLGARTYVRMTAKKRKLTYFDMGLRNSRRDFLQIAGTIGALVALTGVLGAWAALTTRFNSASSVPANTQTSTLPPGVIANKNELQTGVPVYFEFPSGYPNMLMKKADGSLMALSLLCTHICCQCQYDSGSKDIYCPCHGSVFDQNGNVLQGPAASKLPSIQLSVDSSGNVTPVRVIGSSPCLPS